MLPLNSSFYVFYDENVTTLAVLCCVIVADHEDTRWLWIARMVCGARWSPARKTRLSVELFNEPSQSFTVPGEGPYCKLRR